MFSDLETTNATARLSSGKLTDSDISELIGAFRLVLGPLETRDKMRLKENLEALNDSANTAKLAAKMAAGLVRLKNEDFGVAILTSGIQNSDHEQRKLFTISLISLIWPIPVELSYLDNFSKINLLIRKYSNSARLITVP